MDDPDHVIDRYGTLRVLANEFPVSALHLVLASQSHREALQEADLNTAVAFARAFPEYWVFHSMRGAGAWGPEHMHFQALLRDQPVPIEVAPRRPIFETDGATVARVEGYPVYALAIGGDHAAWHAFQILQRIAPSPFNLVVTSTEIVALPRAKERPSGIPISVGAPEMAGWVVLMEEQLYRALTHDDVSQALAECGWHSHRVRSWRRGLRSRSTPAPSPRRNVPRTTCSYQIGKPNCLQKWPPSPVALLSLVSPLEGSSGPRG